MDDHINYSLGNNLVLMVETTPHGENGEYFAGIWPREGGPVDKSWIEADSPQHAFEKAKIWANENHSKEVQ